MILKFDSSGKAVFSDAYACNFLGLSSKDMVGKTYRQLFKNSYSRALIRDILSFINAGKYFHQVVAFKNGMGIYVDIDLTVTFFKIDGIVKEIVLVAKDISKAKDFYTTNLYNEDVLMAELNKYHSKFSLATVVVNNSVDMISIFGIDAFNRLMDKVSSFMLLMVSSDCTIYRVKFNEFVILSNSMLFSKFSLMLKELIDTFKEKKFEIDGFKPSVSIVVGLSEGKGMFAYVQSNRAAYTARSFDIDMYEYIRDIYKEYRKNSKLLPIIKDSLNNDSFMPYFQPVVSNYTMKLDHYEVLARMDDKGSVLNPQSFLGIINSLNFGAKFIKILTNKCFEILRGSDRVFSINITLNDVSNTDIMVFLKGKIEEYDIGKNILLEVSCKNEVKKSVIIEEFNSLRRLGVMIAIDDFDGRYYSFKNALKLQVDYIKISKELIDSLCDDVVSESIVDSIVVFAKKMDIKTIAKGVEDKEMLDRVIIAQIDYSQGYLLSKPLDYGELFIS